jgi:DNA-binding response OmpR family regulator
MILMLVKEDAALVRELAPTLSSWGIDLVHYRQPLKALDNLAETNPTIILYDWVDFPRHWKIMIKYIREEFPKDEKIFLLFGTAQPPLEEANKALFLGVNGLFYHDGNAQKLARKIREVFLRYGSLNIPESSASKTPTSAFPFVFRHPRRKHLVTGSLLILEENLATMKPDFGHETADLAAGEALFQGSLRLKKVIVSLDATVLQNNGQLRLEIRPSSLEDASLFKETLGFKTLEVNS